VGLPSNKRIISAIEGLRLPPNSLDYIVNALGPHNVTEVKISTAYFIKYSWTISLKNLNIMFTYSLLVEMADLSKLEKTTHGDLFPKHETSESRISWTGEQTFASFLKLAQQESAYMPIKML